MLLHIFRHIQTNERLGRVEQILRERLDELGFAHAGRTDKQEGNRLVLGADARARAANGVSHSCDSALLPDNAAVQTLLQTGQAGKLLLTDLGGGNTRPQLDDRGEMFAPQLRHRELAQRGQLILRLQSQTFQLCHVLVDFVVLLLLQQVFLLALNRVQLVGQLGNLCSRGIVEVQAGARLVDEVNRLVRQIAVGDVALGQRCRLLADFIGNVHAVECFVVAAHTHEDFGSFCD